MWTPHLAEGPTLAARIARAVVADVRAGVLAPGARLPGSRSLADTLGVHRNTVIAALSELEAEGWIEAVPGSGTRIAEAIPRLRRPAPRTHTFAVPSLVDAPFPPSAPVDLGGGRPDTSLFPADLLARAWRRAARRKGVLDYGDPRGTERLRVVLAGMLASMRGVPATASDVLVTRGAQAALDLVARTLFRPGDTLAVEALGYRPAWMAFEAAGLRLVSVPVDRDGLVVEAIPPGVRGVYVTPHHQYPTTRTLSAARRVALLDRAHRERFPVLEDDYDHEFHFDGPPVLPLAASGGNVVYIGTLSKILAPGLRLGFAWGPTPLIDALARRRRAIDHCGDAVLEHAVAELLEEDEAWRHVRRATRVYRERRDVLVDALAPLGVEAPPGGIALWLGHADPGWEARAGARGVGIRGARWYTLDGAVRPGARLVYSYYAPETLRDAAKILLETW